MLEGSPTNDGSTSDIAKKTQGRERWACSLALIEGLA